MSTITKEWLQQKIADMEARRDDPWLGLDEDDSNTLAALRIALASIEAEAVAWTTGEYRQNVGLKSPDMKTDGDAPCIAARYWDEKTFAGEPDSERLAKRWLEEAIQNTGARPLYAAPPAPVSVPEWTNEQCMEFLSIAFRHAEINGDLQLDDIRLGVKMVNGSRAAMLQGAEPVTTAYKLPFNTPCKDAPEHIWLQTAGVWPENGEFSELTWCSDNQHQDDTLYIRADVVNGNSSVVSDGWKLVPNEPTTKQWAAGMQAFDSGMDKVTRVYKAMLAAAPQQEA